MCLRMRRSGRMRVGRGVSSESLFPPFLFVFCAFLHCLFRLFFFLVFGVFSPGCFAPFRSTTSGERGRDVALLPANHKADRHFGQLRRQIGCLSSKKPLPLWLPTAASASPYWVASFPSIGRLLGCQFDLLTDFFIRWASTTFVAVPSMRCRGFLSSSSFEEGR